VPNGLIGHGNDPYGHAGRCCALGKANGPGTIEQGKLADLIILDPDPLADLRNMDRVYRVIKEGSFYYPAKLISASK
jgi:imidazolonepropionase-like amidohydrolase